MHHACQEADKRAYKNINPKSSEVYCIANQFRRENPDVVGYKPVNNDAGEMSVREKSRECHNHKPQPRLKGGLGPSQTQCWEALKLLNIEFDWDPDHLSDQPVESPPIQNPNHHWYG